MLAGVLFCVVHLLNGWVFQSLEITDHISFMYLPSFLRLAHVLVLGMVLGTASTAIGGALLLWWSHDNLWVGLLNIFVSATMAAVAVILLRFLQRRNMSLVCLTDLLKLALFYALLNSLGHHLMWGFFDPSQLVNPHQLVYMVIGDINGAVVGALVLRALAQHTRLMAYVRGRAVTPESD